VRVRLEQAEEVRARLIELSPDGFEERSLGEQLELAAYVDATGEERLRRALGAVEAVDVAPGWEDAWRAFHRPVRIGPLWVGPPWLEPPSDALVIVIEPGRAFGTGSHPTTRLCLELLLELAPASVVDLGCGSGVLAIAAARLGCGHVTALDRDRAAIEAAQANAVRNGVRIAVAVADVLAERLPEAELALANLELGLIELLAGRLQARVLVASGYQVAHDPILPGWERRQRRELDGWAADLFEQEGL
jgi:ribosomal protein L11 methyltransferase